MMHVYLSTVKIIFLNGDGRLHQVCDCLLLLVDECRSCLLNLRLPLGIATYSRANSD